MDALVSSVDLTRMDVQFFICDLDERIPQQALASFDISCGGCERSRSFGESVINSVW